MESESEKFYEIILLMWEFCKIIGRRVGVGFRFLKMTEGVLEEENRYPFDEVQLEKIWSISRDNL